MFADERVEHGVASHRFIVGAVVCSKQDWMALHGRAAEIGAARPARRLDGLGRLLEALHGFALLTYADLPIALVPPGELDGTDDIARMTRRDNVWSQTVLATAATVLACLRRGGVHSAEIDLYYDPKALTVAHRDAFEKILRERLPEIARADPETGAMSPDISLLFRRIEQVPKRTGEIEAVPLQRGISLAHHLCSQASSLIAGQKKLPRVLVRNHTDVLRSMVSIFAPDSDQ